MLRKKKESQTQQFTEKMKVRKIWLYFSKIKATIKNYVVSTLILDP